MLSFAGVLFFLPLRKSNAEAISITALFYPYLYKKGLIFNPVSRGRDKEKENKEEKSDWSGTFITVEGY